MPDPPDQPTDDAKREVFSANQITQEERGAMIQALVDAIPSAGIDFGRAVKALRDSVAAADPITVMGAMTMYLGSAEAGTNPEHDRRLGIYQHHLEIAQAAIFRYGTPGSVGTPWTHIPVIAECVRKLNDAWIVLQARKVDQAADGSDRDLEAALLTLRVRASTRRGWAYPSRMVPMLEALLAPLDAAFAPELGFALGQLPSWWIAMFEQLDARLERHSAAVQEAMEWTIDDHWVHRVTERFGPFPGDDACMLLAAARLDDEVRRFYVAQCSDMRAHEIYRFTLDELVELMPGTVTPNVVQRIMESWSLSAEQHDFGDLGQVVLDNPVVGRPFVASGTAAWHLFCGWLTLHNPFELIERLLVGRADLFDAYMQRRAEFLEQRTADALAQALPDAIVERSLVSTDPVDGKTYENDVLALISSYAVVAEAKAGRLHPDVRRGRGRAPRDRVEELLVRPSEQGMRLAEHLMNEPGPVRFTRKVDGSTFTVDAGDVRRTLAVAVTLEPIANLLPRLVDVAGAGLSAREADALVYNISLPDLELAVDLLEHPSEMLHYFARRTEIERGKFLGGDEVDLLALYLQTGFNIGKREFSGRDFLDVTGLSDPIDVWHSRLDAGMDADKPRSDRTAWWDAVLSRLEKRRIPRWAEIGVSMCNFAPPEQEAFEAAMHELRRAVMAHERDPIHMVVVQNGPPQRQDVFVGLIAASSDAAERAKQYENTARMVLGEHEIDRVVILAWTPIAIELPYYALVVIDRLP